MEAPLISIVMGYFNRKPQLEVTLKTIQLSKVAKQVEIIIVDDASSKEHVLTKPFLETFDLNIKVIRIEPHQKKWINPVIPYNLGITQTKGEWVMLQNPEVCHSGDVCSYVATADRTLYHVLPVFSLPEEIPNDIILSHCEKKQPSKLVEMSKKIYPKKPQHASVSMWYDGKNNPRFFHYCSALHKSVLNKVGGFNPNMANGIWYDDDEFLFRVKLVAKPVFMPSLTGFHIYHYKFVWFSVDGKEREKLLRKNLALFAKSKKLKVSFRDPQIGLPNISTLSVLTGKAV